VTIREHSAKLRGRRAPGEGERAGEHPEKASTQRRRAPGEGEHPEKASTQRRFDRIKE